MPSTESTFDEYLGSLPVSLSEVKKKIIRSLWGTEQSFPREWVSSKHLLELTQQKYFDRRIREMRDECGMDIETSKDGAESVYRLVSVTLSSANPRLYLTPAQKKDLMRRDNYSCQVCGKAFAPEGPNIGKELQADHKVPLSRGGPHIPSNFQALCVHCNVSKRRACEGCEIECRTCPWAYPEDTGVIVPVRLEPSDYSQLRARDDRVAERLADWIGGHLDDILRDEPSSS